MDKRTTIVNNRNHNRFILFFFNDTATTEIYTLSLHDALPISRHARAHRGHRGRGRLQGRGQPAGADGQARDAARSEEHTSELQSQSNLVCRLLLEKKKKESKSVTATTMDYDHCQPDSCPSL